MLRDLAEFDLQRRGQVDERTSALQAHLMLLQGNTAEAVRWATSFTEPPARPSASLAGRAPGDAGAHSGLLPVRLMQAQALDVLDALGDIATRTHNLRFMITILALRAVALDALGKHSDAESALREAVDLAAPGGFVRVFLELGPAPAVHPAAPGTPRAGRRCRRQPPGRLSCCCRRRRQRTSGRSKLLLRSLLIRWLSPSPGASLRF